MAPVAFISSTPGCPIISLKSIVGSRDGGGIVSSLAVANCDMLRAPVLGSIGRCGGGVLVKNGCAKRETGDLRFCVTGRFAFLAMEIPPIVNTGRTCRSRALANLEATRTILLKGELEKRDRSQSPV